MATAYTIDSQRQIKSLTPGNQFIDAMEVRFTTSNGTHGMVTVPLSKYTADYVAEVINEYVDRINAVESL